MKKYRYSINRRNLVRVTCAFFAFSLLLNALYLPGYRYVASTTRDNVVTIYQQKLDDGMSTVYTTLVAMANLHALVNQNQNYQALNYQDGRLTELQTRSLADTIRIYTLAYSLLADVGLSKGDSILLTRERQYYDSRSELQADGYFSCEGMSTAAFVSQFHNSVCVLPAATFSSAGRHPYQAFTIAWRWSMSSDIYLFATLPADRLMNLLVAQPALDACYIALESGDTLLMTCGEAIESDYVELTQRIDAGPSLRVTLRIPNAVIDGELVGLYRLIHIFLMVLIAATVLFIVVLTITATRPFNQLTDSLFNSRYLGGKLQTGDGTLMEVEQGLHQLDDQMDDYHTALATHLLDQAIYRGLYTEDARASFRAMLPDFPARYQLAWVQLSTDRPAQLKQHMARVYSALNRRFPHSRMVYPEPGVLLVVLPSPAGEDLDEALRQYCAETQRQQDFSLDYTLSDVHETPSALPGAYQQVEFKMLAQQENGDAANAQKLPFSLQQIQTMYMALSYGDEATAVDALTECAAALHARGDFMYFKQAYKLIANMLVLVKLEADCNLNAVAIPMFDRRDPESVFTQSLPECFARISALVAGQRQTASQQLENRILAFIDENLFNPQLCVSMVTEKFHISAPTLQKRLQVSIGQTFSAYVENARMERARRELIETDKTVQEIAEDCGYATTNSFHKAYKRRFGEAPLSVRK